MDAGLRLSIDAIEGALRAVDGYGAVRPWWRTGTLVGAVVLGEDFVELRRLESDEYRLAWSNGIGVATTCSAPGERAEAELRFSELTQEMVARRARQ